VGGITADSRTVKRGDLFVAIAGSKDDGLRFVAPAVAAGAAAVMAERVAQALLPSHVAFVRVSDARRALALAASRFYPRQPETDRGCHRHQRQDISRGLHAPDLGRDGRGCGQHWHHRAGRARARSLWLASPRPDPVALHRSLDELARAGVTHLALEASSHGLDQRRLDGVRIAAGAFTNISRDHLD